MAHTLVFEMEVDVAMRRPPTPANLRTHFVTMAIEDRPSWAAAESEARTLAALMCQVRGTMVTDVRITGVEA